MLCYAKSFQSCLTLCDPIDSSPPGSPVPGILQARTLEWIAISFSDAWKWKVKVKLLSRVQLLATPWTAAHQAPLSMDFPGKSAGVGCHCLLDAELFIFTNKCQPSEIYWDCLMDQHRINLWPFHVYLNVYLLFGGVVGHKNCED